MINEIHRDAEQRMKKSLESLDTELSKLRTGRAHPDLLDQVKVNCYGQEMPLNQLASVTIEGSRTLMISPWAKDTVNAVAKGIMAADLGLNPAVHGEVIRVTLPTLTEERRQELVKIVRQAVENTRVSIRNIRRDANQNFKNMVKDKEMSEDEARDAEANIQSLTDASIAKADQAGEQKESDLLAV